MDQEMNRFMTEPEEKRYKDDIPSEKNVVERIWKKTRWIRYHVKMSTTETVGEFFILEFKRMSCVTDQCHTDKELRDSRGVHQ
jgi:hypothetical protein